MVTAGKKSICVFTQSLSELIAEASEPEPTLLTADSHLSLKVEPSLVIGEEGSEDPVVMLET